MSPPRVSVICTTRNASRTVGPVLDSILAQTIPEWEFVVVDDGSVDDTLAMLRSASKVDERVTVVATAGIGRGPALNLAVSEARAPLIANVDADDPSHPRRLEVMLRAAEAEPHFAVLGSNTVFLRDDARPAWPSLAGVEASVPTVVDVTPELAIGNPINHSSALFRKKAVTAVSGYAGRARRSQFDYDLWVRLAAAGHRLGVVALPLASKRLHAQQSFERRQRLRYVMSMAECQARAIRAVGAGPGGWVFLAGQLGWGLLPFPIRQRARGPMRAFLARLRE